MSCNKLSVPLCPYALALFPLPRLDHVRSDAKVGLQKELEAKLLVHQGHYHSMRVDVATCLHVQNEWDNQSRTALTACTCLFP